MEILHPMPHKTHKGNGLYICHLKLIYIWHIKLTKEIADLHVTQKLIDKPRKTHKSLVFLGHVNRVEGPAYSERVWRDPFICVTWPIHTCDMTHSHNAFTQRILEVDIWFIYMCAKMRSLLEIATVTQSLCVLSRFWSLCVLSRFLATKHKDFASQSTVLPCHRITLLLSFLDILHWQDEISVWHDSFICVTRLIHLCDMTQPSVWHDSFICVTCLIHLCDMTRSSLWHDSIICVTGPFRMCDMMHIWISHGTHMNELCHTHEWVVRINLCDMTQSYLCHDSFICVTWRSSMWHHSSIWMSHGTNMNESWHTYEWVMAHLWMSRVTHMNESCPFI